MKRSESLLTLPFSRSVQSNNPHAIRKYKRKLEIQIVKFNIEERLDKLYQIGKLNKLNNNDENELNQIDDDITTSMLQSEKSIQTQHYNHPWSPTLHRAIRKVTIWKAILTQIKTGYSPQQKIQKLQKNVSPLITTTWTTMKDIKHNVQVAQKELKTIIQNASKLRKQHLLKRASAHDIQNKKSSPKTIINILKIEAIFKMWTWINSITNNNTMASLNTLDIQIDTTIHRNDIKNHIDLQFKTINNPIEIDQLLATGNAQHLNQAHGTPFTVEPLRLMIGKDSFTPFTQEILDGSANFDNLQISDNIKSYLQNLKKKKVKGTINNKGTIPVI